MENIWANTQGKWCHHVWVTMDPSQGCHGMNWRQRRKIHFLISSMLTPTRIHEQSQIKKSWEKRKNPTQRPMTGGPFIQAWYKVSEQNLLPWLTNLTCGYPHSVQSCFVFGWLFNPAFTLVEDLADVTADLDYIQLKAVQFRLFMSVLWLSSYVIIIGINLLPYNTQAEALLPTIRQV